MQTRAERTGRWLRTQRYEVLDLGWNAGRLVRRLRQTGDPASRLHTNIGAFIVEVDSPGVTRPRVDKKMGVKGIDTTEIVFTDVKVRRVK